MDKKEIAEFIQHYEKITKWMLKVLPIKADLTAYINTNQNIISNLFLPIDRSSYSGCPGTRTNNLSSFK